MITKNYIRKRNLIVAGMLLSGTAFAQPGVTTGLRDTLYYTGAEQTWTVPCGAINITIEANGAQGAEGSVLVPTTNNGGFAGLGNQVIADWSSLSAGQNLYIYVGGAANAGTGGYNGGGNGIALNGLYPSGGGGGATDIRYPSNSLSDRKQVAGGGGGGGNAAYHWTGAAFTGGNGGNGGGNQVLNGGSLDGGNGSDAIGDSGFTYSGGFGGTTSGPGAAGLGCSCCMGQAGSSNSNEIGGNGGLGSNLINNDYSAHGGAGGGGYLGGNGGGGGSAGTTGCSGNNIGAGGGGSAGTNYFELSMTYTENNGINTGNGYVVITYDLDVVPANIAPIMGAPCQSEPINLVATPAGGTFAVLTGSGTFNGAEFTPTAQGLTEVTYTSVSMPCNITTVDTLSFNVTCDVTGLEMNTLYDVTLVPNPVHNSFELSGAEGADLVVLDVFGNQVIQLENYTTQSVNCNKLSSGIYFVQISKEGKKAVIKFVKE